MAKVSQKGSKAITAMKWALVIGLAMVLFGVGVWKGGSVPLPQQQSILGSLQTAGAVVFGIVGAWVAIIYPKTYDWALSKPIAIARAREQFFRACTLPMKMSCAVFLLSIIAWPIVSVLGASGVMVDAAVLGASGVMVDAASASEGLASRVIFGVILVLVEVQALAILWSLRPTLDAEYILATSIDLRERGQLPLSSESTVADGKNE